MSDIKLPPAGFGSQDGPRSARPGQRVHYRSDEQLTNDPAFRAIVEREFPEGVAEEPGFFDEASRRSFLGVVGASAAALTLASCRKPYHKILPYNHRPEGLLPGIPQHYATTYNANGYGIGTVVRSNTGRPTKVEGNTLHPSSLGATDAFAQADLLNLYDPKRSKKTLHNGEDAEAHTDDGHGHGHGNHDDHGDGDHGAGTDGHAAAAHAEPHIPAAFFAAFGKLVESHAAKRGDGLHILMPPTSSPSIEAMLGTVAAAHPNAVVHQWAPVSNDDEVAAARIALGDAYDTIPDLAAAKRVVTFDHDFLGLDGSVVRNTRSWTKTRKARPTDEYKNGDAFQDDGGLGRLYVCEATHSVTGSNADHRFRLAQTQIPAALAKLAAKVGVAGALAGALAPYAGQSFDHHGVGDWVDEVAADLLAHKGQSLVLAGPRLPAAAQALAHAINAELGNVGKTVNYAKTPKLMAVDGRASLSALADALETGKVETLLILGSNPVYDAPADLDFAAKLAKAKHTVHLGLHVDETGALCEWHVPMAHPLESWGDLVGFEGQASVVQPLIAPLFGGQSTLEMLARLVDDARDSYEIVKATWQGRYAGRDDGFVEWFEKSIHDGVLGGEQAEMVKPSVNLGAIAQAFGQWKPAAFPSATALEVVIRPDNKAYDGRFSNNAWMLEFPDPLTKLTWDNAALMARSTAKELGLTNGDVVRIKLSSGAVEAPVWILPGAAPFTVILTLGFGRKLESGAIANGCGYNAYPIRTGGQRHVASGATVEKTGATYPLVSTQNHGSMEERPLARDAAFGEYADHHKRTAETHGAENHGDGDHGADDHDHGDGDHGHGGHHAVPFGELDTPYHRAAELHQTADHEAYVSLFDEQKFASQHQWGMSIDQNSCTGCGACVVACVAENNIPMVGKRQVSMGREMHWLRVDRYFSGKADSVGSLSGVAQDDDPQVHHQMVPCMQCENAPCESVCPVNATVHNDQGLNDMVYNRCIGTRYCSNNCPYKVRRFNWLNFHRNVQPETQLAFNPDVTVRVRGVMEKCTYCVQRINNGKLYAKLEKRELKDGDIVTACAQACPADAIAFGDLSDHSSEVYKRKRLDLNYAMLGELNVKPRTTYLLQLRNPNPKLVVASAKDGDHDGHGGEKKHG